MSSSDLASEYMNENEIIVRVIKVITLILCTCFV